MVKESRIYGQSAAKLIVFEMSKIWQIIYYLDIKEVLIKFSDKKMIQLGKEILDERWKIVYIDGKETMYEVSNKGNIRNHITGKLIKTSINRDGYQKFNLCINGKKYTKTIHRLVALAFIDNPYDKPLVNHKDGNKLNCEDSNLEWATSKENMQHAIQTGLAGRIGVTNPRNKYSEEQVHQVCKLLEDGKSAKDVARILSVSINLVSNIRDGKNWTSISKFYDVQNSPMNHMRPKESRGKLIELIRDGYSNKEIVLMTGLPNTSLNMEYVGQFRRKLLKRSTTIEHSDVGVNTTSSSK